MAIRTQQSLTGFIASDPQLSFTARGDARFYAKVGQEHFRREDDGTFTRTGVTLHDLVMYRKSAERAYERFAKGDNFVAEGYVHAYEYKRDGEAIEGEEFAPRNLATTRPAPPTPSTAPAAQHRVSSTASTHRHRAGTNRHRL